MICRRLGLAFLSLVLVSTATSCVLFRDYDYIVPGDFYTIQEAIDYARPGDTILIDKGVYSPSTNGEVFPIFLKDGVDLIGEDAERTILDAENTEGVLDIFNYRGTVSRLTLRNGITQRGGGIFVQNSEVTLRNLYILNNRASEEGSGIFLKDSDGSVLQNLVIAENVKSASSDAGPAQVDLVDTSLAFTNNVVAFGDGNGLSLKDQSKGTFENNIFYKNGSEAKGVGFADTTAASDAKIQYNLFFGNIEADFLFADKPFQAELANTISPSDLIAENFSADPLFVNPNANDYTLNPQSPAIHAGDPDEAFQNRDKSRNTIGAFGGPEAREP